MAFCLTNHMEGVKHTSGRFIVTLALPRLVAIIVLVPSRSLPPSAATDPNFSINEDKEETKDCNKSKHETFNNAQPSIDFLSWRSSEAKSTSCSAPSAQITGHLPAIQVAPLHLTVVRKLLDITLIVVDILLSLGNRSAATMLLPPPADSVFFLADGSLLGVDLGTDLTFLGQLIAVHDQFHAAGLTSPVFFGAVLSEVTPLPALAGHLVCVVETHGYWAVDGQQSAWFREQGHI
jgi:hypothetical protein